MITLNERHAFETEHVQYRTATCSKCYRPITNTFTHYIFLMSLACKHSTDFSAQHVKHVSSLWSLENLGCSGISRSHKWHLQYNYIYFLDQIIHRVLTFKTDCGTEFVIPKGDLSGLHKGYVISTTLQCLSPLNNITETQFVTFFWQTSCKS